MKSITAFEMNNAEYNTIVNQLAGKIGFFYDHENVGLDDIILDIVEHHHKYTGRVIVDNALVSKEKLFDDIGQCYIML